MVAVYITHLTMISGHDMMPGHLTLFNMVDLQEAVLQA